MNSQERLKRALDLSKITKSLPETAIEYEQMRGVVAHSAEMKRLLHTAVRVASVDTTVLITGESGVGKERVATLLHAASQRAQRPFVSVNCAAISESLLESELFGHARGAFTGAVSARAGLFEAAHRGTILLDEIGEISPGMQVKLLRVLQEREIRRVGENTIRSIDVRIIAATNRNLSETVAHGLFREDLYYRLNVLELHVPPLRNRTDDIMPLATGFLVAAAKKMNRRISGFCPDAVRLLTGYNWPGNVRELENTMERAALFSGSERVETADLPAEIRDTSPLGPKRPNSPNRPNKPNISVDVQSLDEVEKKHILRVLELNAGNQANTALQLGIGTATLYRKLRKYGRLTKVR
ncbi:MAG: sigma-54-dependent Fis family transcriptional regulator [Deltaproteobacteria bacterium]|nr:sigma-54-dependent Fis family transcriptional regulator [Deltaproteobacteria bacterium]